MHSLHQFEHSFHFLFAISFPVIVLYLPLTCSLLSTSILYCTWGRPLIVLLLTDVIVTMHRRIDCFSSLILTNPWKWELHSFSTKWVINCCTSIFLTVISAIPSFPYAVKVHDWRGILDMTFQRTQYLLCPPVISLWHTSFLHIPRVKKLHEHNMRITLALKTKPTRLIYPLSSITDKFSQDCLHRGSFWRQVTCPLVPLEFLRSGKRKGEEMNRH